MTRVLLIGGSGQLGTAILQRWSDCEIVAPPHGQLGIEQSERLARALADCEPDVLINAAAFHDVDRCELEPQPAFEINAFAVGRAAHLAREREVTFVTFGTDYAFDGATVTPYAESAAPHPLSVYGLSKLTGEHLALSAAGSAFVVRTCGVYGAASSRAKRAPFIDRVLAQGKNGEPVRVVNDVIVSPTFAGDLADALRALIESRAYGLYHAVNEGPVSWYDFAREAIRQAGIEARIEPIAAAQWKGMAIRPRFSALDNAKLRALGIAMPSWRDGIAAYFGTRAR